MTDQPVTTDISGINRTPEGQITTQPPTPPTPTTTPTPTPPEQTDHSILNQTEAPKPPEAKPQEGEKPPIKAAPDSYSEWKLPEGFTFQPEAKKEVETLFKGMNLTQEDGQKLVDFYAGKAKEAMNAPIEAYNKMKESWLKESQDHPDLRGKLGPGKEVNVRIAKALDSLNDPKLASDFRQTMDLTGAGNNQAFIRVIDAFAKKITEGSHVVGNGPAAVGQSNPARPVPSTPGAALWPNLPSAQGR